MQSFSLSDLVLALITLLTFHPAPSLANSNWTQEMRDYTLEIHNDRRRAEGGCQINKLVYDMELEKQAKKWAEGCIFKHELIKGRGENLAWNSNMLPEKELIKSAADRWFNEKNIYSYGQYSCGSACHYTQMVWDITSKVGCYTTRCQPLRNAWNNAWYFVCFYTPQGNWDGQKPYQKSCSSPCRKGQTQEKGLCVGEAEGGDGGAGAGETCEDKNPDCPGWASRNECSKNPDYMKINCKKSCKVCTSKCPEGQIEKNGVCTGTPATTSCKDEEPTKCPGWAKSNQCTANPSYMKIYCKKSCKVCT